jgi:hypothetical protein
MTKESKIVLEILDELDREKRNDDALIGYEVQQYGNCEFHSNSLYRTFMPAPWPLSVQTDSEVDV